MDSAGQPGASSGGTARTDILARIDERELEIERMLADARERAAAGLGEARRRAAAIAAGQRERAAAENANAREAILAQARARADEIRAAGSREAAAIRAIPRDRIEGAAERLFALVLPQQRRGGDGP